MNNSNPFVPKGSILELQSKRRSRLKLAVFGFLTVAVVGLTVMLIQGCKREQPADTGDLSTPMIDTNLLTGAETNTSGIDTNLPVMPPTNVVTPPAAVVPPAETASSEYVVVKGDTLDGIAKKNHVTIKALEAANPGVVPTKLKIGQKLVIPSSTAAAPATAGSSADSTSQTYVVKSGDTLTKIAKAHGTTVKAIQNANNLTTTSIKAGQKLVIPSKASVAAPLPVLEPAPAAPAMPATAPAPEPAPAQ